MEFTFEPYQIQNHDFNVSNTTYLSIEIMKYFEDNRISDILQELLLRFFVDEPKKDVAEYLASNLQKISKKLKVSNTFVMTPKCCTGFDSEKLAQLYAQFYKIPIINFTRTNEQQNDTEMAEDLKKFLKFHHLQEKNLILFDFPSSVEGIRACENNDLHASTVIEIVPENTEVCQDPGSRKDLVKFLWRRRLKQLHLPVDVEDLLKLCKNLREMTLKPMNSVKVSGSWCPRVLMIGRRSSGANVQAALLAKEFGLILVHVEHLVSQLTKPQKLDNVYVASLVYERLLQPDCLHNGWVLVGYPKTVADLEMLYKMIAPPNKIVFLHTRERVCLRRLLKNNGTSKELNSRLQDSSKRERFDQLEMEYFNYNIRDMVDFCTNHKTTGQIIFHIDGNHSIETVKNNIWCKLI